MDKIAFLKTMEFIANGLDDNGMSNEADIFDRMIAKVANLGELPKLPSEGFVGSDIYSRMTLEQLNQIYNDLVRQSLEAYRVKNTNLQVKCQDEIAKVLSEIRSRAIVIVESNNSSVGDKRDVVVKLKQMIDNLKSAGSIISQSLKDIRDQIIIFIASARNFVGGVAVGIGAAVLSGLGIGYYINRTIGAYADVLDQKAIESINGSESLADISRSISLQIRRLSKDDIDYEKKIKRLNGAKQMIIEMNKEMMTKKR